MKRTLIPAALCLFFAGSLAFAQQPQTPQSSSDQQPPAPITRTHEGHPHHAPDPHRQAMMMSRRLNLTPDQTARVEPILADTQQKMMALHTNTSLTPQDMHQQMHAIHQGERTQLDAVLTPDQQQQLKAMHHGHHGDFHGQGQPPQPTPGL